MSASLPQCPTANQQEMLWNKTQHPAKVTDLFTFPLNNNFYLHLRCKQIKFSRSRCSRTWTTQTHNDMNCSSCNGNSCAAGEVQTVPRNNEEKYSEHTQQMLFNITITAVGGPLLATEGEKLKISNNPINLQIYAKWDYNYKQNLVSSDKIFHSNFKN